MWKAAYVPGGMFWGDPRGLSAQLYTTDGVNPFGANEISYSRWPLIMVSVLNWPKKYRNYVENLMVWGSFALNGKDKPKMVLVHLR